MKVLASISLALAVCVSLPLPAQRLPKSVAPTHYRIALTPDLAAATFAGEETIDLALTEPTRAITLNAIELKLDAATVTSSGKTVAAAIALDEKKEQATFTVPTELPAGPAQLHIAFRGTLNGELRGFYLSKTAKRNYAVTQFESTDARRAFPSFDEPAFKATFDVTLVVDAADTAISNMPIASDTPGPAAGKHTLRFAQTPKMSSYLVAFLVGDFQCSAGEQDGVKIRVCATPDKVGLTPYGVDVAKSILHYYNNYFGIPFPLPKLDLIALPDFEAGAMENFGAITYRETELLVDDRTASVGTREDVNLVIAHEMAHQWFGDLVTMRWWDNLWLNEGFATWMESKPVAALHPEWKIEESNANGLDGTLNLDAQPTTRAIRAQAESRAEIEQMFDGISYGKAGAVLNMVENYLGEETFRQGVHKYLAAHLYSNATAEDFWTAQTEVSRKPVDKIMESFVAQPGEPILIFGEPTSEGRLPVAQHRFYLSPSIKPDAAQQWTVPVCFKSGCQLLTPGQSTLQAPAGLAFANAGGKGYYRSAYTAASLKPILDAASTALTPAERIALVGDQWAQVRANQTAVGSYLDLAASLKNETSYELIAATLSGFSSAYERLAARPEQKQALAAWLRANYGPVYRQLPAPTPNDDADLRQRRALLMGYLGYLAQDPEVLAQAREIGLRYLDDPASVEPTLGQSALQTAARAGDAALFDRLKKIAETSTVPEQQEAALRFLTVFENPALLERGLDYAVSGKVRNQDALGLVAQALLLERSRNTTWAYMGAHWDKIEKLLTPEMGGAVVGSAAGFCTAEERKDVERFFAAHKVPDSDQTLRHTLEKIDGCIEFRRLQGPRLDAWLAAQAR